MRFLPLLMVIILFVVYPIAQYPAIQSWDSFLHGMMSQEIVNCGYIPNYSGYFQYPSAFLIESTFSIITGLPIIESGVILCSSLTVIFLLVLLSIGNAFLGRKMDWLMPTIYFVFVFEYSTGALHYAPQFVGQLFYFISILIFFKLLKFEDTRKWGLLFIILLASLVTVHSFSMLYVVATIFALYLFGITKKLRLKANRTYISLTFLFFASILTISWYVFVANGYLRSALSFTGLSSIGSLMGGSVAVPLQGRVNVLLQLYRYGVYVLFGSISLVGLWRFRKQIEKKLVFGLVAGVILGTIALVPTPASWGGYRTFYFGGAVVAILASYVLIDAYEKNSKLKLCVKVLCSTLPILILLTFTVSTMYLSNYSLYIHPNDVGVARFAVQYCTGSICTTFPQAQTILFYGGSTKQISQIMPSFPSAMAEMAFNSSQLSLQNSLRQESFYGFGFVDNAADLLYSNGLNNVYYKPNSRVLFNS